MIRPATLTDAKAITEIYNYYINNDMATFEENTVNATFFEERINTNQLPWLVFEINDTLLGYVFANQWKPRSGYRYTAEATIYLHPDNTQKGIGTQLYTQLIEQLKELGFRSVIGGITLPNPACVALHHKFGFKQVAHFKNIGYKRNTWADVGYWQLDLG